MTLLRVLERPAISNATSHHHDAVDWEMRRAEAQSQLSRIERDLKAKGLTSTVELLEGRPAEQIINFARAQHCDLVVLSSHGEGGLTGWALSSTALMVVARTHGSLLVVPAHGTDGRRIGALTPVRVSGDLAGSAGEVTLIGPKGSVTLKEGVINDERHLHVSDTEAEGLGLRNGDIIDVAVPGETPLIVRNTVVRIHPSFRMNIHLDTDEANAASLDAQGAMGEIVGVHPKNGPAEHFMGDI